MEYSRRKLKWGSMSSVEEDGAIWFRVGLGWMVGEGRSRTLQVLRVLYPRA